MSKVNATATREEREKKARQGRVLHRFRGGRNCLRLRLRLEAAGLGARLAGGRHRRAARGRWWSIGRLSIGRLSIVRLDDRTRLAYIYFASSRLEHDMGPYHVTAEWDEEAEVWVASSEDVPGLATGADTLEALIAKLKIVIPELLIENGLLPAHAENVPFAVKAERTALAPVG